MTAAFAGWQAEERKDEAGQSSGEWESDGQRLMGHLMCILNLHTLGMVTPSAPYSIVPLASNPVPPVLKSGYESP